jgi:hypothetical protein
MAVSRVEIKYLSPAGIFRRRKVTLRSEMPQHLWSGKDRQLHTLRGTAGTAVFPKSRPKAFKDWRSFVDADSPPVQHWVSDRECLIDEDGHWPYSNTIGKSTAEKLRDYYFVFQQAFHLASAKTARDQYEMGMAGWGYMTALIIAGLLTLGILFVGINAYFDRQEVPNGSSPGPTLYQDSGDTAKHRFIATPQSWPIRSHLFL